MTFILLLTAFLFLLSPHFSFYLNGIHLTRLFCFPFIYFYLLFSFYTFFSPFTLFFFLLDVFVWSQIFVLAQIFLSHHFFSSFLFCFSFNIFFFFFFCLYPVSILCFFLKLSFFLLQFIFPSPHSLTEYKTWFTRIFGRWILVTVYLKRLVRFKHGPKTIFWMRYNICTYLFI